MKSGRCGGYGPQCVANQRTEELRGSQHSVLNQRTAGFRSQLDRGPAMEAITLHCGTCVARVASVIAAARVDQCPPGSSSGASDVVAPRVQPGAKRPNSPMPKWGRRHTSLDLKRHFRPAQLARFLLSANTADEFESYATWAASARCQRSACHAGLGSSLTFRPRTVAH